MLKDKTLIFITDKPDENKTFSIQRRDGEGNSVQALKDMQKVLTKISNNVVIYTNVSEFEKDIKKFKNPLVVTSFYGEANPTSKAVVPIICDLNNIPYVGADAYVHMLCNDKFMSKQYIEHFGLKTANSVIIYDPLNKFELQELSNLKFPVVIKPNFGGGSNGIEAGNVKKTLGEAINFIKQLYYYQNLPILVEEYLEGNEVSLIMFGNNHELKLIQEVQIIIDDKEYYTNEIFGLESKKKKIQTKTFKPSNLINMIDKEKMITLFKSFTKVEFMRIDCRIKDGNTSIIELSPDCYLGLNGAFYEGFRLNKFSFQEMIQMILSNVDCLSK